MWIIGFSVELHQDFFVIGFPVAGGVAQQIDRRARGKENFAALAESDAHAIAKSFGPRRDFPSFAVRSKVLKDANAIARRPLIFGGTLMGVILNHPNAAALIHGDAGRRDNLRLASDQLDN